MEGREGMSANAEDLQNDLQELRKEFEVQAATQGGAQATQAATQAGQMSTMAATQAGTWSTMAAGWGGMIVGMFLGLAIFNSRK